MSEKEIQFKDITFGLSKLGQIEASVERDGWTVPITNDMEIDVTSSTFKPRSFATFDNSFSDNRIRSLGFKLRYKDEPAGNLSVREYGKYMFIFDMKLDREFRGKGGGSLMVDLYKASLIFSDKEWAGGFVGDGNTLEFLMSQGFSRAEFETWTNNVWGSHLVSGDFVLDGNYYDIPRTDRFGLVPTPTDIVSEFSEYVIQPTEKGTPWTIEEEQRIIEGGPEGINPEGRILFPSRVRRDVAMPFWEGGWSTWFKIPTRKVEFEENVFPITNRNAPVLDRFRDPTFSVF